MDYIKNPQRWNSRCQSLIESYRNMIRRCHERIEQHRSRTSVVICATAQESPEVLCSIYLDGSKKVNICPDGQMFHVFESRRQANTVIETFGIMTREGSLEWQKIPEPEYLRLLISRYRAYIDQVKSAMVHENKPNKKYM